MFVRREWPAGARVALLFEGRTVEAFEGESVAAALVVAGIGPMRTMARCGTPRAAYCMMGVCFDCLMVIDGEPNRQACMVPVQDGMQVERQDGTGDLW